MKCRLSSKPEKGMRDYYHALSMWQSSRYLLVCHWAQKRYTGKTTGYYTVSVGGEPSIYSRIEELAWRKYMGAV